MINKKKTSILIIYLVAFFGLWTVFEFIGKDFIDSFIENNAANQFVKSGITKNLVWTLPAIMLVKYFKDDVYVSLKDMFNIKVNWLKYIPVFIAFTVYIAVSELLQNGRIAVNDDFGAESIIIVLFVGLTEEMVFRGWLLNITVCEDKKWLYILFNALLFLAIHFPRWICDGMFISAFTSLGFISVLILSVIFSLIFIKSRNILVPITLHMYWDLLMFMI
ncbi:MAG: CPBP family intramembrane metalloprotease [Ruminococcus sp.]|nr:CPBP family intramembrane metalloprotease [Ruminococcus sp.]